MCGSLINSLPAWNITIPADTLAFKQWHLEHLTLSASVCFFKNINTAMFAHLKTIQWNMIVYRIKFRFLNMARKTLHSLASTCFSKMSLSHVNSRLQAFPSSCAVRPMVSMPHTYALHLSLPFNRCTWKVPCILPQSTLVSPSLLVGAKFFTVFLPILPWILLKYYHSVILLNYHSILKYHSILLLKYLTFLWICWLMCLFLHQPGQFKDRDFFL